MRRLVSFLAVCLCLVSSLDARPQDGSFVLSPNQTFYLDLDTAEAVFSQWQHRDIETLTALSATIRVPRLRNDRKYVPAFTIWVQNAGVGEEQRRLGVQLTALNRKPPLEVNIIQANGTKLISIEPLPLKVGLDQDLTVDMSWAEPHSVKLKVGGQETRTIALSWSVEIVAVTASTGQLKTDPLLFGTIRTSGN
jgi:hypothetical protein